MLDFSQKINMRSSSNDLLTIGELLVDLIADDYGDAHEQETYSKYFGGSPANIAMNVRKLGCRSQLAAAVGDDGLGAFLLERLRRERIDSSLVETVEEATSVVLLTKSRATPIPIFYRHADCRISYRPELEERLKQSKLLHFSCWPLSGEPSRSTVERLTVVARTEGIWTGFDPNYHPRLWSKDEAGAACVKAFVGMADIVKPSEDDAERLFGPDTPERQIDKFLELGARLVILTLGKDGAIASNGRETLRFPTMATEVTDTTGAGDAFWSGLYAGLIKGYALREAISLGFAVSAYKLRFTGAVVDLPDLETLRNLYGLQDAGGAERE